METVGRFEILEPLGAGALGRLYRARDAHLGHVVALRVVDPAIAGDPAARQALLADAARAGAFSHPHAVALLDLVIVNHAHEIVCLVHELAEGQPLSALLSEGPIEVPLALGLAAQVAGALAAGVEAGLVHGALEPDAIIVSADGQARVLDFGLSRWTASARARGQVGLALAAGGVAAVERPSSLYYVSPEQLLGAAGDGRADVFALGAILHEMLTGRPAFGSESETGLALQILRAHPDPPSRLNAAVPTRADAIVRRALAKSLDQRYPVAELAADLQQLLLTTSPVAVTAVVEAPAPEMAVPAPAAEAPAPELAVPAPAVEAPAPEAVVPSPAAAESFVLEAEAAVPSASEPVQVFELEPEPAVSLEPERGLGLLFEPGTEAAATPAVEPPLAALFEAEAARLPAPPLLLPPPAAPESAAIALLGPGTEPARSADAETEPAASTLIQPDPAAVADVVAAAERRPSLFLPPRKPSVQPEVASFPERWPAPSAVPPEPEHRAVRPAVWAMMGAAAVIVLFAGVAWFGRNALNLPWQDPITAAARPNVMIMSFAVAGEGAPAYFGPGFAEDLAARLSEIPGGSVVGRASIRSTAFVSDWQVRARNAGATFVVRGTVRPGPYAVHADAELLDVASGKSVWSQHFTREPREVPALLAEIAGRVAQRLRLVTPTSNRWARASVRKTDPAAYDLYLQGREAADQRDRTRAINLYDQALRRDPGLVEARAAMSQALYLEEYYAGATREASASGRALREAETALAVDAELPAAHLAAALSASTITTAASSLSRALGYDPSNGEAWHHAGDLVNELDPPRSIPFYRASLALEPSIDANWRDLASAFASAGSPDGARQAIENGEAARPDRPW